MEYRITAPKTHGNYHVSEVGDVLTPICGAKSKQREVVVAIFGPGPIGEIYDAFNEIAQPVRCYGCWEKSLRMKFAEPE